MDYWLYAFEDGDYGALREIAAIAFTADIAETNVRLAQSYRKLGDKL